MIAGFAEPVLQAQACFRAALEALARPGRVFALEAPPPAPAPLCPAAAALLLTLCDAETPVHLLDAEAAWPWLAFHTGAPRAASLGEADFVLAPAAMPPLARLNAGSDEAPQLGATLILQLASLDAGRTLRLTGPGIEREQLLRADGLPADFAAQWAANRARFPRGVDLLLCAGDRLAGLSRTTSIEELG
jgi:alpha-D-ribose 1-methylphosphonate 5-triphosphate synthase subunit PhnH